MTTKVLVEFEVADDSNEYKINKAINELVFPKYTLKKAYNYYNGVRDPEQFRYLESNFGIALKEKDTESTYMERLGYLKVYDSGLTSIIFNI